MTPITVTTMVENSVSMGVGLIAEHGLAFLIKSDDHTLLFDTGQGMALAHNAGVMNIDLKSVDTLVLSHGHYDHTGGIRNLLSLEKPFRMVAHPDAFSPKLASFDRKTYHPIGNPVARDEIANNGVDLVLSDQPVSLAPGMKTTGVVPEVTDFETIEGYFFTEENGQYVPDKLGDDLGVILDTPSGTVLVLGCTHRGIINTLKHVESITGSRKLHAVMGGLHLGGADDAKMKQVIAALKEFEIDRFIIGHCTGAKAMIDLTNAFPGKVTPNTVGHNVTF